MSKIPDVCAPSNPHQATSIADLITPNQLHWLTVEAESVGLDKEQTALALFQCSVYSLSRNAALELEQHFARLKMNAMQGHKHEHDCAVCGDTFDCNQSLCNATLSRYCHDCKADLYGATSDQRGVQAYAC